MTIATFDEQDRATFGSGGAEPYARALRTDVSPVLYLRPSHGDIADTATMDVSRWSAEADDADLTLLASVRGPVLDVGCGPGRMVRAAMDLGLAALGIDVSPTAVEIATDAGLSVLQRSIFEPLPAEGGWHAVLLVDGNIGIGGDVTAMLARCRGLIAADGEILVEVADDPALDRTFSGRVVDTDGRESASFPWAQIGLDAIVARAEALGLELRQSWRIDGRSFCRLADADA